MILNFSWIVGGKKGFSNFLSEQYKLQLLDRYSNLDLITPNDSVLVLARSEWNLDCEKNFLKSLNDNYSVVFEVLKRKPKKVFYFSSIDVYQKIFPTSSLDIYSLYPIFKKATEELIISSGINYLIFRPGLMLNDYNISLNNSTFSKILFNSENGPFRLSGHSNFFPVTYSYLIDVIEHCLTHDVKGCLDVVGNNSITLSQISEIVDIKVEFGEYIYRSFSNGSQSSTNLRKKFNISSKTMLRNFL